MKNCLLVFLFLLVSQWVYAQNSPCTDCDGKPDNYIVTRIDGFVITCKMMRTPINKLTFLGSHNAYANNDERYMGTKFSETFSQNHELSMRKQLEQGVRFLEWDLIPKDPAWCFGLNVTFAHGNPIHGYTKSWEIMNYDLRPWLEADPYRFMIVNTADIKEAGGCHGYKKIYEKFRDDKFHDSGLLNYVYEPDYLWEEKLMRYTAQRRYPTLQELLCSGKRVFYMLPFKAEYESDWEDLYVKKWENGEEKVGSGVQHLDDYAKERLVARVGLDLQSSKSYTMMNVNVYPNHNFAGNKSTTRSANSAHRLYKIAQNYEALIQQNLNSQKVVNVIQLDYVGLYSRKVREIGAVNRMNWVREFGESSWTLRNLVGSHWDIHPYVGTGTYRDESPIKPTFASSTKDDNTAYRSPNSAINGDLCMKWQPKDKGEADFTFGFNQPVRLMNFAICWDGVAPQNIKWFIAKTKGGSFQPTSLITPEKASDHADKCKALTYYTYKVNGFTGTDVYAIKMEIEPQKGDHVMIFDIIGQRRPDQDVPTGPKMVDNEAENVVIYPNPVKSILNIELPKSAQGIKTVSIMDAQGSILENKYFSFPGECAEVQLDLSIHLPQVMLGAVEYWSSQGELIQKRFQILKE
ncbi:hypothetical protein [Persicobacter diffluens]|uniref:Secretion system C-terminal sorting domain-containing protein n=1 Tax=Persicobacter diffluens TaxID=981 RepID=A0AAN5AKN1_9BACT|nr:hypothetical protein PEDI_35770 [Persicobacter diffluens]